MVTVIPSCTILVILYRLNQGNCTGNYGTMTFAFNVGVQESLFNAMIVQECFILIACQTFMQFLTVPGVVLGIFALHVGITLKQQLQLVAIAHTVQYPTVVAVPHIIQVTAS